MSVSRLSRQSIQSGFPKQQSIWDGLTQPSAMDALGAVTVTSAVSNVVFSSIPSTYTHLQLRVSGRDARASSVDDALFMYFNTDNTAHYTAHGLYGYNGSASTDYRTNQTGAYNVRVTAATAPSSLMGSGIVDILDYTNVNKYKTIRTLSGYDNNGTGDVEFYSAMWIGSSGTPADVVSTITIWGPNGNIQPNSSLALYGIK